MFPPLQLRFNPTSNQNIVTYPVVVSTPNEDMKLLPGMTASLTFLIREHKDVLKVPNGALRFPPEKDHVRPEDQHRLELNLSTDSDSNTAASANEEPPAVTTMVSIGTSAGQLVQNELQFVGTNFVFVQPSFQKQRGVRTGGLPSLTVGDAEALGRECDSVLAASPLVGTGGTPVVRGNNTMQPNDLHGVGVDYLRVRNWQLDAGGFFSERDVFSASAVFIVGHTVVRILFQTENRDAVVEIRQLLMDRHQIAPGQTPDFEVQGSDEIASMLGSMTGLLASIAGISLLVGGVGIMNIMLVSVTERTREIGIRMAVGARGRDILIQFLIESIVLSCFGGAIGMALGIGASVGITHLINSITSGADWPVVISIPAAITAMVFAAFVGMVFRLYPAWRASRLDPIDALRYE